MGLYSTQSRCSDELTTVGYGGYAVRVTPCPRSVPGRVRHPSLLAPVRLFLKMVPYSARASNSSELPVAGNGGAAAIFLGSGGRPSLSPPFLSYPFITRSTAVDSRYPFGVHFVKETPLFSVINPQSSVLMNFQNFELF
jgi:hypothetical protein